MKQNLFGRSNREQSVCIEIICRVHDFNFLFVFGQLVFRLVPFVTELMTNQPNAKWQNQLRLMMPHDVHALVKMKKREIAPSTQRNYRIAHSYHVKNIKHTREDYYGTATCQKIVATIQTINLSNRVALYFFYRFTILLAIPLRFFLSLHE